MFPARQFLDLAHTEHRSLFQTDTPVWEALGDIAGYLEAKERFATHGKVEDGAHVGERVFLGKGSVIEAGAHVRGPAWIGEDCVIRPGAYIRENVITGNGCVLGNSSEFKNCLLFDGCEVPHFNYVGDSILGHRAHLGAGAILSNVRLDRSPVCVKVAEGAPIDTGLKKFGAIIGDLTEVGCNSVLSPGSILGRRCIVYPGTQWRGVLGDDRIVKLIQQQEIVERR